MQFKHNPPGWIVQQVELVLSQQRATRRDDHMHSLRVLCLGAFILSQGILSAQASNGQCEFDANASAYVIEPPTKGWIDVIRHFDVFFHADRHVLTSDGRSIVSEAAAVTISRSASKVVVWGYTDTVGPADVNDRLSFCRAVSVADELVRLGVPKRVIRIWGAGESAFYQAVKTPDETREPRNNRATIDIM